MAYAYKNIIVASFLDHASAERAVLELKSVGFSDHQIGLAAPDIDDEEETSASSPDVAVADHLDPVEAAETGAMAGASLGALVSMGILAGVIPVIGPVVALGALSVILINAAEVTAIAGVAGALVGMGVSEAEAHHFEGELKAGKVIVTVEGDGREDEVAEILFRNGGRDRQNEMPDLHNKIIEVTEPETHVK